ncbi:MAG: hypothetical protein WBD20_03580 [Pirellulaceae bacterium]
MQYSIRVLRKTTLQWTILQGCLVVLSMQLNLATANDEVVSRSVLNLLVEKQKSRERQFGNLHAIWRERIVEEGKSIDQIVEFWSRDNTYFRCDVTAIGTESAEESSVLRTVVRPEGFVKLTASNSSDPGAVIEFGPFELGWEYIRGHKWFCGSNRDFSLRPVADNVIAVLEDRYECPWINACDYKIVSHAGGGFMAKASYTSDAGTTVDTATLAADDFCVLECTSGDATAGYTARISNEYGIQRVAPIKFFEEWIWKDGSKRLVEYTLEEVQFEPAVLSVFDIGDVGLSTTNSEQFVGIRRLIVLAIGLVMVAAYFKYRRSQPRE